MVRGRKLDGGLWAGVLVILLGRAIYIVGILPVLYFTTEIPGYVDGWASSKQGSEFELIANSIAYVGEYPLVFCLVGWSDPWYSENRSDSSIDDGIDHDWRARDQLWRGRTGLVGLDHHSPLSRSAPPGKERPPRKRRTELHTCCKEPRKSPTGRNGTPRQRNQSHHKKYRRRKD